MKLLIVLISLLFSTYLFSSEEIISSYQISLSHPQLPVISDNFEIKKREGKKLLVYVLKERVEEFLKLAPNAPLIDYDINLELKKLGFSTKGYHSYPEVRSKLSKLNIAYPNITVLEEYGKSRKGNPLLSFTINKDGNSQAPKPRLLLTAATHGDEIITVEVLLKLLENLLLKQKNNPRFKRIVEHLEISFVPVVNPDGFIRRRRYAGRVDPNRAYPWPENPRRDKIVSCINHLINYFEKKDFNGTIDFHAYGKMVMFPWGYSKQKIRANEYSILDELTKKMAKKNRYKHGAISKVIYVAKGNSADYYFWKNNSKAIAVELSTSKSPSSSKIPSIVKEAEEMLWTYFEHFIN